MNPDLIFQDLLGAPGHSDPYPLYEELRRTAPVHWNAGTWYASRYEDCARILRDPQFRKTVGVESERDTSLVISDPPLHTRLRTAVAGPFSAADVAQLRSAILEQVAQLTDKIGHTPETDFMASLSFPLTLHVIGELLGVPIEDRVDFEGLNRDMTAILQPAISDADVLRAEHATRVVDDYFKELFQERRRRPQNDLISLLVAGNRAALTEGELLTNVKVLFGAGFETTSYLLGNSIHALIMNPTERKRLVADPSLIRSAVEEFLRYDGPVQTESARYSSSDVILSGKTIRAGEPIVALLGAANQDESQFSSPRHLNLSRSENKHLAFGGGIHFCLGAGLARLEATIFLSEFLKRYPHQDLASQPRRRDGFSLRGFDSLPITLGR